MNCSVSNWYQSQAYVDLYVKIPVVRAKILFGKPIRYLSHGSFVDPMPGIELLSGMADVLFKFKSQSVIDMITTGFSRIRVPIIVCEKNGSYIERLVFMTSHDRTVVAASGSRVVNPSNILKDYEHLTPLVLFLADGCAKFSIHVNSGGKIHNFDIGVTPISGGAKFNIPDDLDVKSRNFMPKAFDADFSSKKMKRT